MKHAFRMGPEDVIQAAKKMGRDLPPSRAKAYLGILDFLQIERARNKFAGDPQEQDRAAQNEIARQLKGLGVLGIL